MSWFCWLYIYAMWLGLVIGDFNGPVDTTVKETADVLLTCSSLSGVAITFGAWSDSDGIFAADETLLKTTGKYSNFELDADAANGKYDIRIDNAEYEEQGPYFCQIDGDPAKSAVLTVEAQVTSVTLTVNGKSGSSVDVMAGEQQTLVCTAVGARPRVGIDWTNNGVSISGDTETESINGDTIDTISTLLYTPTRNDDGHQFQCVTTGQQAATPQSQSVTLNVQFAPVEVVVEYSQGTITCSSAANPDVADNQYVITLNDTDTSTGKTLAYDPESNGCTTVKCTAANTIGTATGSRAEPLCPNGSINKTTTPTVYESIPEDKMACGSTAPKEALYGNVGPELSFSRDLIVIKNELGRGAFGRVFLATAQGIKGDGNRTKVAIKTLKDGADGQAKTGLLQELDLMKKVGSHPHVVNLLGYCVEKDPIYLIVEYLSKGDLKNVLIGCRSEDAGYVTPTYLV